MFSFTRPTTKEEFLQTLSEVDEYYRPSVTDFDDTDFEVLSLNRLEQDEQTDMQLIASADNYATYKLQGLKYDKKMQLDSKIQEYTYEKNALENQKAVKLQALKDSNAVAYDKFANNCRLNGITGSVLSSMLDKKTSENTQSERLLESEYDEKISKLGGLIAGIELQVEGIENWATVNRQIIANERLEELKKEREEWRKNVLKYNNECVYKELNALNSWKQAKIRLDIAIADAITNGYSEQKLEALGFYADKLSVVNSYYSAFTPVEAYNDFASTTELVRHLGKYYHETLYQMYKMARESIS